jgi:hypothetical protein
LHALPDFGKMILGRHQPGNQGNGAPNLESRASSNPHRQRAPGYGANPCLRKPFDMPGR